MPLPNGRTNMTRHDSGDDLSRPNSRGGLTRNHSRDDLSASSSRENMSRNNSRDDLSDNHEYMAASSGRVDTPTSNSRVTGWSGSRENLTRNNSRDNMVTPNSLGGSTTPNSRENILAPYSQDVANLIFSGLQRLFESEVHTDTEIVVDSRTFRCHKCVLSSVSTYFDAMFSSGMRESQDGVVHMKDVSEDTFESVLKFIYYGQDVITSANAVDLLKVCTILDIKQLHGLCEEYLCDKISAENCIDLWRLGRTHVCRNLEDAAFSFILEHFADIHQHEEFLMLDKDEITSIVQSDDLHVPNEEMVCEAVFKWCHGDEENRRHDMADIFEFIRLPLVTSEFLLSEVESNELIRDERRCREIVKEAISYHMLPAKRSEINSPRMNYRKHDKFEEVFLVIGGYDVRGAKLTDVIGYSIRRDKWFSLANLKFKVGREFATCSYGNDIFVSGGSQKPESLQRFSAEYNRWDICTSALQARRRHVLVAVGECLYALGGYDDRRDDATKTIDVIDEYNISDKSWRTVGNLQRAVRSNSAIAYREKIYLFGGICADQSETNAIQCFDTRLKTCTVFGDLPFPTKLSKSIVCDKSIYMVCTDGTILELDEEMDCKPVQKLDNFNRRRFGILHHKGNIVILAGENGIKIYEDMIYTDPVNQKTWSVDFVMSPPRANFGCARIFINKSFLETPLERYQTEGPASFFPPR